MASLQDRVVMVSKAFENFIDACREINAGTAKPVDFNDGSLATVDTTMQGTAIWRQERAT
jgi:hypothetical protein